MQKDGVDRAEHQLQTAKLLLITADKGVEAPAELVQKPNAFKKINNYKHRQRLTNLVLQRPFVERCICKELLTIRCRESEIFNK